MSNPYLGAGANVGFDVGKTGTFVNLIGVEAFPAVGTQADAKVRTTVNNDRVVYGVGLKDSPDFSLEGQYNPQDADQQAFITACKAGTVMDLELQLPQKINEDGSKTDVTVVFEFQPLGYNLNELTPDEWVKFTVTGKQNTDAEETITATPAP